ncbi:EscU/YscU/HrcU family type III secretion system export apparatus switch protein [bacterium]|nr:EscU/YscU/HrcU family type III secretion system export apparatus switch protein [bacterium]
MKRSATVAERIVQLAEETGVPLVENSSLSALLEQLPESDSIPERNFLLIAEVLCFLYEADQSFTTPPSKTHL